MSRVNSNTIISSAQPSMAYTQINFFSHQYDRGGAELINGKPSFTADQAADQLLRERVSWHDQNGDGKIQLSYSFLTTAPDNFQAKMGAFIAFGEQQKAQAFLALQSWSDVSNVTFTEADSGGDGHLSFGSFGTNYGVPATAFVPEGKSTDGQSWYLITDAYQRNLTPENGDYGRHTLTHEIGHTLGLAHPGVYNASSGRPTYNDVSYAQDTRGYSLMSYWSESNTQQNFAKDGGGIYAAAPLMDDIIAIQKLYGANMNTRTENTVYGFNSNTERDFYSATSSASKLLFSVWDAGGEDTLDFSGFTHDQKINLNESSFSDVGGLVGNISIVQGVTIENAKGGWGNDLVIGNAAVNQLVGGAGNDILYGGGGRDTLWGGTGNDIFVFGAASDSTHSDPDWIGDFVSGQDKIDLTGITAFSSGTASLNFVSDFTGSAGDAVLVYFVERNESSLLIDLTGNGAVDFAVATVGLAQATDIVA